MGIDTSNNDIIFENKMIRKSLYITLFLLSAISVCFSQNMRYSQSYVLAENLNPALSALGNSYKFGLLHRNQWSKLPSNLMSTGFNFSLSNNEGDLAGGLIFNQSKASSVLVNNEFGFVGRKSVSLKSESHLHFGMSLVYGNYNIDRDQLVFGDQLNINGSVSEVTVENIDGISSKSYLNLGGGVAYQNSNFFMSLGGSYLNQPNVSLLDENSKRPIYFHFMSSYKIDAVLTGMPFSKVNSMINLSIRPFLVIENSGGFSSLDFGSYLQIEPILFGIKYRGFTIIKENDYGLTNKDALSFMIGYDLEKISLTYSYDLIFTDVDGSGGTHELGVVFRKPNSSKLSEIYF